MLGAGGVAVPDPPSARISFTGFITTGVAGACGVEHADVGGLYECRGDRQAGCTPGGVQLEDITTFCGLATCLGYPVGATRCTGSDGATLASLKDQRIRKLEGIEFPGSTRGVMFDMLPASARGVLPSTLGCSGHCGKASMEMIRLIGQQLDSQHTRS